MSKDNNGRDLLIAGTVIFLASLAGLLVLSLHEKDTTQLMALVGPVIAALLITGHVNRVSNLQNDQVTAVAEKVEKVEKQTNGVLDDRIRKQTTQALMDAGLIPPPSAVHVDLSQPGGEEVIAP